jgi:zinc transporter ZupT
VREHGDCDSSPFCVVIHAMKLVPLLLSLLPVCSTLLGGYIVYRWKRDLHPWLSLSGGVLLGVAFLDLLPEALEYGETAGLAVVSILGTTLLGIVLFHLLDRIFSVHAHHEDAHGQLEEPCDNARHTKTKTWAKAGGMIVHSFFDGLVIGGGFAVDVNLGLLVTLAVIMHDFSDGMSIVTVLRNGLHDATHRIILPFLMLGALAPFAGSLVGMLIAPSVTILALLLALFAGFFTFLALSELLPQAHAGPRAPHRLSLALTIVGILIVVFVRSFVSI